MLRLGRLALCLLSVLILAGCGGSASPGGSGAAVDVTAPRTTTVYLTFPEATPARASDPVTAYRVTGYNATNPVLFGPQVYDPAPLIRVSGMPAEVTSLFIESMAGGRAVDTVVVPVQFVDVLTPIVVTDPMRTGGHVSGVTLSPARATVLIGKTQVFTATGTFPDGSIHDLTQVVAWSAEPTTVASITAPGVASAIRAGSATVSATLDGVTGRAALDAVGTVAVVTSDSSPKLFSQGVTFTVTVTVATGGPVTGTATFFDGAISLGTAPVAGGTASLRASGLAVGTHAITAAFDGGARFPACVSAPFTQVIEADVDGTHLGSSANPSVFGQSVTFTATVVAVSPSTGVPTGTVTFMDGATSLGTVALAGGQATLPVSTLAVGTHSMTAVYSGDSAFAPSTSAPPLSQVVGVAPTTTGAVSSGSPSVYGFPVTFTATVQGSAGSGIPTGSVTFTDGGTTLGTVSLEADGTAAYTTSSLSTGTHSVVATYGGDASRGPSASSAVAQVVSMASETVTLGASSASSTYGQSVTFTATVTPPGAGTPTGDVTFQDGATVLSTVTMSGGQASLVIASLGVGPHSLTATYSGDANFQPAVTATPLSHPVGQATPTVTLVTSRNGAAAGSSVTFTATVTPPYTGQATGNVVFSDGASVLATVALGGGTAACTTSALTNGLHTISAVYNGDTNFQASDPVSLQQSTGAFYTSYTVNTVQQVLWNGQVLTYCTLPQGERIFSADLDAAGNLYCLSQTTNRIYKVDPAGNATVLATLTLAKDPYSLVADAAGNVYVLQDDGLWKCSDGTLSRLASFSVGPTAVLTSNSSRTRLYANLNGAVVTYDLDGRLLNVASGAAVFEGLALDEGSGSFYCSAWNYDKVFKYTNGNLSVFVTLASNPTGMVVAPDGYLYVLDYTSNRILKMSLSDGSTTLFATLSTGIQIIYH